MAAEYQEPDRRVVDYHPFCLDPTIKDPTTKRPLFIRGPRPRTLKAGGYFVCLGAAQTFGRFCDRPFPTLLQEKLDLPVLNLSHGGAGPLFFCGDNARLLDYVNGARFVVIQVMSARSESNSLFESDGVGHYRRRSDGVDIGCDEAFAELIRSGPRRTLTRVVDETRSNWRASYQHLLSGIHPPTILLWFATRTPRYVEDWSTLDGVFGAYPQLVDEAMVSDVRPACDAYVECVTRRGLPQQLTDRFTGAPVTISDPWTARPWTANWYYPTPEMHVDAAAALEPCCRELASARGSPAELAGRS